MINDNRFDEFWQRVEHGLNDRNEPDGDAPQAGTDHEVKRAAPDKPPTLCDLADAFLDSRYGRDYSVIKAHDTGFRIHRFPAGKWVEIIRRDADGKATLYAADDPEPVEVRSAVLAFLRNRDEPISSKICEEIEKLARLLVLQRGDR